MKLQATNLRGVSATKTLDITGDTCFVGHNGTGKTTMATVPYYVLSGKGLSIRDGETESSASITLGGMTITREKKGTETTLRLNGSPVTGVVLSKEMALRGMDKEVLTQLFAPRTQLDSNFLLRVAGMSLTPDNIDKYVDFSEAPGAQKRLTDFFAEADVSVIDIPAVEQAEKNFFNLRRQVKKEVTRLSALAAAAFAGVAPADYAAQAEQAQKRAEQISAQLSALEQEINSAQAKNAERSAVERSLAQHRASLDAAKKGAGVDGGLVTLLRNRVAFLKKAVEESKQKLSELEATLDEAKKQRDDKAAAVAQLKTAADNICRELNEAQRIIDVLTSTKQCPLYAGMPCTADKSEAIAELEAKKERLNKALAVAQERLDTAQKELDGIDRDEDSIVKAYAEQKQLHDSNLADCAEAEAELTHAQLKAASLQAYEDSIRQCEKTLSELPPAVDCTEMLAAKDALLKDLSEATQQKGKAEVNAQKAESDRKVIAALSAAQEEQHDYDFLVKAMRALPCKIFSLLVAPLRSATDEITKQLGLNWSFRFDISSNVLTVNVQTKNGIIALDELSGGEQVLANYVLKQVVCKLIGFDVLFLDETEALDPAHMKQLADMMRQSKVSTVCVFPGVLPVEFTGFAVEQF